MAEKRIVGLNNFKKRLQLKKAVIKTVDKDFRNVTLGTVRDAKKTAPVKRGIYRASIKWRKKGPLHYEVHDGVNYGKYLEFGTIYMAGRFILRNAADKNLANLGKKVAKRYE